MARPHCSKNKNTSIGFQASLVNSHNLTNYDKTVADVLKTTKAFFIIIEHYCWLDSKCDNIITMRNIPFCVVHYKGPGISGAFKR